MEPGVVMAAAIPISPRRAINCSAVETRTVAALAVASRASPISIMRRRPNRSASEPNSSMRPPKATA